MDAVWRITRKLSINLIKSAPSVFKRLQRPPRGAWYLSVSKTTQKGEDALRAAKKPEFERATKGAVRRTDFARSLLSAVLRRQKHIKLSCPITLLHHTHPSKSSWVRKRLRQTLPPLNLRRRGGVRFTGPSLVQESRHNWQHTVFWLYSANRARRYRLELTSKEPRALYERRITVKTYVALRKVAIPLD
jgi:hypothetical protein